LTGLTGLTGLTEKEWKGGGMFLRRADRSNHFGQD
jgi:hypothetical protein